MADSYQEAAESIVSADQIGADACAEDANDAVKKIDALLGT